ncbi:hypothetical protein [Nocardia sp. CA-120079]|uniref:hypothetical protein n=1 Tax=Nocardia sp. CA-120079 TaxID=3239974 RepID=UPI003D964714
MIASDIESTRGASAVASGLRGSRNITFPESGPVFGSADGVGGPHVPARSPHSEFVSFAFIATHY